MEEIPPELVLNWDQTGINIVPASLWTMDQQGKNRVEMIGLIDKWVISYHFTKLLHMTPLELNEIWCVGSSSGLIYPKGISLKLLVWLP